MGAVYIIVGFAGALAENVPIVASVSLLALGLLGASELPRLRKRGRWFVVTMWSMSVGMVLLFTYDAFTGKRPLPMTMLIATSATVTMLVLGAFESKGIEHENGRGH